MDNMINFNSQDWDSIKDTIDKINKIGEMQFGTTYNGEDIVFDVCKDDDGNDCLVTSVFQKNGWTRKNTYNPVYGTIDETYKKE